MAIDLKSISHGKTPKPPRIILVGVEKIGKSTFASQSPSPIFVQVKGETGLDMIEVPKFPPVAKYEELMEVFAALDGEHEFKTVCLDSVSTLEPMICEYACRQEGVTSIAKLGGGYGRQEEVLCTYARQIMDSIDYLRDAHSMGCILICHTKANPKTFNDPETDPYDTWKVEMRDSIASAFFRWADAILFATWKRYTKSTEVGQKKIIHATGAGERVIYTEKRPAFTAGTRYRLPFELNCSYAAFAEALAAAQR